MNVFVQTVIDAVSVGGLFSMMALGIGLIFGILRLINFAHGELVMIGAYAMWLLVELPARGGRRGLRRRRGAARARDGASRLPPASRGERVDDARRVLRPELPVAEPRSHDHWLAPEAVRLRRGRSDGGRVARGPPAPAAPDHDGRPHPRRAGRHRLVPQAHRRSASRCGPRRRTSAWRGCAECARTGSSRSPSR